MPRRDAVRQYVLIAANGYGCHLESGIKYMTLCGRTFDPDDVEPEAYEPAETHDDLLQRSRQNVLSPSVQRENSNTQ